MREDMKHVVIRRPRTGGEGGNSRPPKGSKRRWQRIPVEDHPKTESTARRRRYGWQCKELNDHLSPLRRWLRKQCGRRWDDVYAEICAHLRTDSVIQAHVRDHVNQDVVKDTRLVDGVACDSKGDPINPGWPWRRFYVDPRDGTLRATEQQPRWRRPSSEREYVAGEDGR